MKKEYDLSDRLPGYSICDMEDLDSFIELGGTKDEFDMLKEYWDVKNIMFEYFILKELRRIIKIIR